MLHNPFRKVALPGLASTSLHKAGVYFQVVQTQFMQEPNLVKLMPKVLQSDSTSSRFKAYTNASKLFQIR